LFLMVSRPLFIVSISGSSGIFFVKIYQFIFKFKVFYANKNKFLIKIFDLLNLLNNLF